MLFNKGDRVIARGDKPGVVAKASAFVDEFLVHLDDGEIDKFRGAELRIEKRREAAPRKRR
jgi:hypothetical protein